MGTVTPHFLTLSETDLVVVGVGVRSLRHSTRKIVNPYGAVPADQREGPLIGSNCDRMDPELKLVIEEHASGGDLQNARRPVDVSTGREGQKSTCLRKGDDARVFPSWQDVDRLGHGGFVRVGRVDVEVTGPRLISSLDSVEDEGTPVRRNRERCAHFRKTCPWNGIA